MTRPVLHGRGHVVNTFLVEIQGRNRGRFDPSLHLLKLLRHGFTD